MAIPNTYQHRPVLLSAVIENLCIQPGGTYIDGTLGGGGHTEAILEASAPDGRVLGIDRDPRAIEAATARLERFGSRFEAHRGTFDSLAELGPDWIPADGILLDLGVSSPQLDTPERGFSFQHDGPVDMRMDTDAEQDASSLLAELDENGLARILRDFGEEPRSRRIARAILAGRPWHSTTALAQCVAEASGYKNSRTHPATRTFQAIRIAVNDELGQVERVLSTAFDAIRPGGRIAVISFHSLEDRLVKHAFRTAAGAGTPRDVYGNPVTPPKGRIVHKRGISGRDADPQNPRARSARLRIIERIPTL